MNSRFALGLSFIILFLLAGCKSDTVTPDNEQYITGTVRNSAGVPVANANLNFSYRLKSKTTGNIIGGYLLGSNPDSVGVQTSFAFSFPARAYVRLTLENYLHEKIKTIVTDTMAAGMQEVDFLLTDSLGRTLYSDMYYVHVRFESLESPAVIDSTRNLFLLTLQHLSANPSPFVTTNTEGRFSIPLSRLPLNEIIPIFDFEKGTFDTLELDGTQRLCAFTSAQFGFVDIPLSNPSEQTITFAYSK